MNKLGSYVVVSPVRDEERDLEACIRSLADQTVRPAQWVLVDDGSTDRTAELVDGAAVAHSWVTAVHRRDRGYRQPGAGVIAAFYEGLEHIVAVDWCFLVKLDGDLVLPPDYFERCLSEFARDPILGIAGGILYHLQQGTKVFEPNPRFHVRGATKIYRRGCWTAIGGLVQAPGWDTIDEVKAHLLGWDTRTLRSVEALHRRPTGSLDGSWRNAIKDGLANYVSGYHPLFMLLRCAKQAFARPYGIIAAGLFYGYVTAFLRRLPSVDDPEVVRYLRHQQLRRLLFMDTIWR